MAVVDQGVHAPAEHLVGSVADQGGAGRIDERAVAVQVDAADALAGRLQQQAQAVREAYPLRLDAAALGQLAAQRQTGQGQQQGRQTAAGRHPAGGRLGQSGLPLLSLAQALVRVREQGREPRPNGLHQGVALARAYHIQGLGDPAFLPQGNGSLQLSEFADDEGLQRFEVVPLRTDRLDQLGEALQLAFETAASPVIGLEIVTVAGQQVAALAGLSVGQGVKDRLQGGEQLLLTLLVPVDLEQRGGGAIGVSADGSQQGQRQPERHQGPATEAPLPRTKTQHPRPSIRAHPSDRPFTRDGPNYAVR